MRIDGPQITGSFSLNGDGVQDLESLVTTSSLNTYTSSMATTMGHVMTATQSLNTFTSSTNSRIISIEGKTGSFATTGSNTFVGTQTIQGSVVPSLNNTYDLGSPGNNFRHLYLSSASLYIDGTKVLGSTTQELQITTDTGQSFKILEAGSDTITLQSNDGNITLATSGGGDVILDPTTGIIALKGTTQVYSGNKVRSSDGNNIVFGDGLTVSGSVTITGFIEAQELRTTYISSSILYRSGSTKFGDELTDTHAFSGSLSVSGSMLGTSSSTAANFVTNGSTLYGFTLKGRSSDNYGAIGYYSSDGVTRYGYVQSHSTNGGQLNITADGGGQIIMDSRGVVVTSALSGSSATFSGNLSVTGTTNEQLILDFTAAGGSYTYQSFRLNGVNKYRIIGDTTGNLIIRNDIASTNNLTLSSTGAATFADTITSQVNGSTFGTASATGRAVIIQGGSANQAIQFKNAAGGDATLYVEGTSTAAHYRFDTYSTSNALFIANGGNIGLGTNNPSAQGLTIYQTGSDRRIMLELNRPNNPGLQSAIQFTVGSSILVGQIQHEYVSSNYNHMSFTLRSPGGSNFTSLWLENSGNIGVGTASPTAKLHIVGDNKTSGYSSTDTLEFTAWFQSGTHSLFTLSDFSTDTVAVASLEWALLYAYAGTTHAHGVKMASTRRSNNNTIWTDLDNTNISVVGDTSYQPNLYWDAGVLKMDVGSSVQITARIRLTAHTATITRNYSAS